MHTAAVRFMAAALLLALVAARSAAGQGLPPEVVGPRPPGRVVDPTGRLGADERREITALLDGVAAQTRGDMMVVVIPSTFGTPHRRFATDLFNRWQLGTAERDDGLLLFAALDDRRAEIILGDGLDDPAHQASSQRVMNDTMVPQFKAGRPGEAIRRGALACATEILGGRTESPAPPATDPVALAVVSGDGRDAGSTAAPDTDTAPATDTAPVEAAEPPPVWPLPGVPVVVPREPEWSPWGGLAALGGGVAATGAAGYGMWHLATRRRRRSCRRCHVAMIKLDERTDDARLGEGEGTEEALGSVDYDVWTCPLCPLVEKLRYPAFFTQYARCPSCRAVTTLTTTSRVRSPTTDSEGTEEVTESCRHCGRHVEFQRSIPRLPAARSSNVSWSSGSSSRGGSSFGGGRSSGGGASGSW